MFSVLYAQFSKNYRKISLYNHVFLWDHPEIYKAHCSYVNLEKQTQLIPIFITDKGLIYNSEVILEELFTIIFVIMLQRHVSWIAAIYQWNHNLWILTEYFSLVLRKYVLYVILDDNRCIKVIKVGCLIIYFILYIFLLRTLTENINESQCMLLLIHSNFLIVLYIYLISSFLNISELSINAVNLEISAGL